MPLHDFFPWLSTDTHTRLHVRHLTFLVDYYLPSPYVLSHECNSPLSKMLPANGIIYFVSSAFCFQTCIPYLRCVLHRFVRCPNGLYLYLHHPYEPRNFYGSYSTGVTPDKNSNKTTSSEPRSELKGDTLKKWESTLNLCVHAHGYDVELIMKAPCNDNYSLYL